MKSNIMLLFNAKLSLLAACCSMLFTTPAAAELNVVTTIKPLHSIVSNIMKNTGKPHLLIDSAASPHDYKLKPSNARALAKADIIFWVGPTLESKLAKPIQSKIKTSKVVQLLASPKLDLLKMRDANHRHHAQTKDPHIWLSIKNAKVIATIIADRLSEADINNRSLYAKNLELFHIELESLGNKIRHDLMNYSKAPILMHHDAFQYFETEYHLMSFGAVTASSEHRPGAKRITALRHLVKAKNIACVFSEPQYNKKILQSVISHSDARLGTLDAIGINLLPGPDLYQNLMKQITKSLLSCLTKP